MVYGDNVCVQTFWQQFSRSDRIETGLAFWDHSEVGGWLFMDKDDDYGVEIMFVKVTVFTPVGDWYDLCHNLIGWVGAIISLIGGCVAMFCRYGMLYMAKVMREALMDRFPDAQEKDVLKVRL